MLSPKTQNEFCLYDFSKQVSYDKVLPVKQKSQFQRGIGLRLTALFNNAFE